MGIDFIIIIIIIHNVNFVGVFIKYTTFYLSRTI